MYEFYLNFIDMNGFFKITPSLSRFSKPTKAIANRIALAFNVDILQIVIFYFNYFNFFLQNKSELTSQSNNPPELTNESQKILVWNTFNKMIVLARSQSWHKKFTVKIRIFEWKT